MAFEKGHAVRCYFVVLNMEKQKWGTRERETEAKIEVE